MTHEAGPVPNPLRLFFYRPGIDFFLDKRFRYITVPLALDTSVEPACNVEIHPEKMRFDPITQDWRNSLLWKGYRHDRQLFVVEENPAAADYFVFPYMLEEMIETAGSDQVVSWLRGLPYFAGNEQRHIFMTLHDCSEPFDIGSVCLRASVSRRRKDTGAVTIPYVVPDLINHTHFDPSRIRYDASFVGFIGCPVSGPVRRQVIASLTCASRIRTFVSPSNRFHGHQGANREYRRNIFLNSIADSWMVVCPRGTGLNSYRFFETLSMGRIPVLLSDDCLLPFEEHIAYDKFILRIPEKSAGHIADYISGWLETQPNESLLERCRLARKAWEEYFAKGRWVRSVVENLPRLGDAPGSTIVVDGIIFQLQQQKPFGISRLWHSLLSKLGRGPLSNRLLLLDRAGTAPQIYGIRKRPAPGFRIGSAQTEASRLDAVCREEGAGLFISTYYTYTEKTPSLLMLYDMIPERFDTVGPEAPNPEWRDKHHAIMGSNAFTAISRSTAADLIRFYPKADGRVLEVVHCAVPEVFRRHSEMEVAAFRKAIGLEKPYFLLVGRPDSHKNLELFFNAFARLPMRGQYAIVMAGGCSQPGSEMRKLLGSTKIVNGYFPDEELSLLYSGAVSLVYPSLYEGFGLPLLEAMQSGCPVITCHNSSIFEVAGPAALYVDERDAAELAKTLIDVQQPDIRSYLIDTGCQQARRFSWEKSAELMAAAIQNQLDSGCLRSFRTVRTRDEPDGECIPSSPDCGGTGGRKYGPAMLRGQLSKSN